MYTVISAARMSSGSFASEALEGLGRTLETAADARRHADLLRDPLDRFDRFTERRSWREIERQRDGGELRLDD